MTADRGHLKKWVSCMVSAAKLYAESRPRLCADCGIPIKVGDLETTSIRLAELYAKQR